MKSKLGMLLALLTLLELTFASQAVLAANEITRLVPFQGRLHGGDNNIVSDGTYDLTFYVYDTPTGGTSLWTETHPSVSVIHGYVNVLLGAITPMVESNYATQAPLYGEAKNTVNFAQQKYLGISINGGAEMFPRSQLVPTFHAYTANHATHATQADNADKLGDKAASTYAQVNYVNNADGVLNTKIDNSIGDINTIVNNNFSERFSGNKAKDADKLDGLNSSDFLRNTAKANDAEKLDGKNSTDFSNAFRNVSFGGNNANITTVQFISLLESKGAFNVPHWVGKGSWNYDGNQNVTDTGLVSSLELAGAVVEVSSNSNTNYSIRVTGAPSGGAGHRIFEYINHGASYAPSWKEIVTNKAGKAYDSDKLDGLDNSYFRNASNLNAGTIAHARLPAATTGVAGAVKKATFYGSEKGYYWDRETGYITQWGVVRYTSGNSATVNEAFRTSFTTLYSLNITHEEPGFTGYRYATHIVSKNANTFQLRRPHGSSFSQAMHYIAIGYKAP